MPSWHSCLPVPPTPVSDERDSTRLLYGLRHSDHIFDGLITLHWLQAQERVRFKTAVLVYKATHGTAPSYLSQLVRVANLPGERSLRCARTNRLLVPSVKLSTVRAGPSRSPDLPSGTACRTTCRRDVCPVSAWKHFSSGSWSDCITCLDHFRNTWLIDWLIETIAEIWRFNGLCKMAAVRYLEFVRHVLGLYHWAKFGSNRYSSFDNMKFSLFCCLACKRLLTTQKWREGWRGDFEVLVLWWVSSVPKMESNINETPKRHILARVCVILAIKGENPSTGLPVPKNWHR